MQVKDFENFEYRQRKPWIAWLLVLVILLVVVSRIWTRRQDKSADEPQDAGIEAVAADDADAPVAAAAADAPESVRAPEGVRRSVRNMLVEARSMVRDDAYLPARELLFEALALAERDRELRREVEELLGEVNIEMVMTRRAMPEKVEHQVQPAEIVARIARRYGTTVELIQRSNGIDNPDLIRVGQRLMVLNKPFSVHVNRARNELALKLDGRFFKRYPVGTGKYGTTPIGVFEINDRIPEPVWWRPDGRAIPFGDPENILGTRWLAIRAVGDTREAIGYGLHGTWDDDSIGKSESAGCVRMHNHDVEELFVMLPVGTPVTIVTGD